MKTTQWSNEPSELGNPAENGLGKILIFPGFPHLQDINNYF